MTNYYTSSGKFSPIAILLFILLSLTLLPLLGLIYAYAIWYIPIPYINFFIAGGFGLAVGWLVSFLVIRYGKVRNGKLAFALGLLGALLALYFHWAVWVDLVINAGETYGTEDIGIAVSNADFWQVVNLATSPGALFSIIGQINEYGTWGISDNVVSGTFLTVIWVIEALIVIVAAMFLPPNAAAKPFCEVNNKWFSEKTLSPFTLLDNETQSVSDLESGNIDAFRALEKAENIDKNSHSIFTLFANETNENYLTIENKMASLNEKGETKFDSVYLVNTIAINEELSNLLESKGAL